MKYLQQKITARFGDPAGVVVIHGGVAREARRAAIAAFNSDPVVRVTIANDAAGEGVNLQRGAHLMVNYDLPWNPNRLEQRFGRIHRIGQTEVCHLWNLCASNTREGEVYGRLLEKLKEAREALGGRVFDGLGELFEGHALRDLLVDAIRYGDRPETKAELFRKVDGAVDVGAIEALVAERIRVCTATAPEPVASGFCEDPAARVVVELAAMEAAMAHERSLGHTPIDVSAQKKGWDIESRDGAGGPLRLIEVKGRHADARDVIITKNEILASLNAPEAFHLALVAVSNGFAHQPVYVQRFFKRELGFAETAVVFNLNDLLSLRAKAA